MAASRFDVVVVGAGIIGLATARELQRRRPGDRVGVVDKETVAGAHQTSHSSGVVHRGVYYAPGSLKAQLCVEGAAALLAYCDEREPEARAPRLQLPCDGEPEDPAPDDDRVVARHRLAVGGRTYVWVYSGPEPPSGGVSRPPLALIAPHWTQFDGVSLTSTVPSPSASPTS